MISQARSTDFPISETFSPQTDPAFQRYRLIAWLGRGGMSEVFLAGWEHTQGLQRLAVMKRLNGELSHNPVTVQMFLDEARLGLRLNHPNIVHTHDVGTFQGRPCILMEHLKGQPLYQLMSRVQERNDQLPLALLVKIVVDVLEGLSAAHDTKDYDGTPLEVVHRDISPHNVFIEYDGRVKVLDFGIAKAAIHEGKTRTGLVKGKFAYMAPEQARSGGVDCRADIWSVGVVLWELLTGARLFKGPTEAAMLNATLTAPIPYPSAYRSDVPPLLESVVQKALERDPERRYGSAREMKRELEAWLDAHRHGLSETLAGYMTQVFAVDRDEQLAFLRELLARRESAPTSSGTLTRLNPASSIPESTQFSRLSDVFPRPTDARMVRTSQPAFPRATETALRRAAETRAPDTAYPRANETALVQSLERKNRLVLWALLVLVALFIGLTIGIGIVILRPPARGDALLHGEPAVADCGASTKQVPTALCGLVPDEAALTSAHK